MREPVQKPNRATDSTHELGDAALSLETGSSSLSGRLRPIDFVELRRLVSIEQVLDFLQWLPVERRGPQLRGPCPIHGSSEQSRTFSVNVERNVFRCFKPACDVKGNQLDLYALATGLPLLEAAHELCRRAGVQPQAKRLRG